MIDVYTQVSLQHIKIFHLLPSFCSVFCKLMSMRVDYLSHTCIEQKSMDVSLCEPLLIYMCVIYLLLLAIFSTPFLFYCMFVPSQYRVINIIHFIINVISAMCVRNLCVSESYYTSKSKSRRQLVVKCHLKTTNTHVILNYTGFRISYYTTVFRETHFADAVRKFITPCC